MGLLDEVTRFAADRKPGPQCSVCKWLDTLADGERVEWQEVFDSELRHADVSAFMRDRDVDIQSQTIGRHRSGHR